MNQSPGATASGKTVPKQRWALGALIAATTTSVVLSISAWAGSEDAQPAMSRMGMMHGAGPDMGGMPFGGRHLQRLLDDAKVSDTQRLQIKQIVDKAQDDLKVLHEEGRGLHEQGLKLWAAPRLDADAAEKLRQQMAAHHDKVSKRMMLAMLDVGNVLTPEQRATVAKQMTTRHQDMMRRMEEHRGGHRAEKTPPNAAPARQTQER